MALGDTAPKMQIDSQDVSTQELEEFFVKKLEISKEPGIETNHQSAVRPVIIEGIEDGETPIKFSISQHYNHSVRIPADLNQTLEPLKLEGSVVDKVCFCEGAN